MTNRTSRVARTVLEQKIRERRETFEEFAEYVERVASAHNEPGTLSVRHLQRLAAGRKPDGAALGPLRPATSRLLERIFSISVDELLCPTTAALSVSSNAQPLRVAVAVVIKDNEVLVVCRRGNERDRITWQFPAGIVKPGVASEIIAARETLAETGVHCRTAHSLGTRLHPITNVYCDYHICEYLGGNAQNVDVAENVAVTWVHSTHLSRYISNEYIYPPIIEVL